MICVRRPCRFRFKLLSTCCTRNGGLHLQPTGPTSSSTGHRGLTNAIGKHSTLRSKTPVLRICRGMSPRTVIRRVTRASGGQKSPELVATRMRSFASSLSPRTAATFLAIMTTQGLENYLVTPDTDSMNKAALSAAHAVTGKLAYADELPDLHAAPAMRHLFFRPGGTRASTTQSGKDPLSMAASLADMPVGSWVAITMRAPYRSLVRHEDRAWDRWIKGRIVGGTHHSLEPNGVIAHVAAASTSCSSVDSLLRQVAGDMHGFDLETRTVSFPRRWVITQHLAAALALLAVGIGGRLVASMVAAVVPPDVTATIGA